MNELTIKDQKSAQQKKFTELLFVIMRTNSDYFQLESFNYLNDDQFILVIMMLSNHPYIEVISIDKIPELSPYGRSQLQKVLAKNKTLKSLYISQNPRTLETHLYEAILMGCWDASVKIQLVDRVSSIDEINPELFDPSYVEKASRVKDCLDKLSKHSASKRKKNQEKAQEWDEVGVFSRSDIDGKKVGDWKRALNKILKRKNETLFLKKTFRRLISDNEVTHTSSFFWGSRGRFVKTITSTNHVEEKHPFFYLIYILSRCMDINVRKEVLAELLKVARYYCQAEAFRIVLAFGGNLQLLIADEYPSFNLRFEQTCEVWDFLEIIDVFLDKGFNPKVYDFSLKFEEHPRICAPRSYKEIKEVFMEYWLPTKVLSEVETRETSKFKKEPRRILKPSRQKAEKRVQEESSSSAIPEPTSASGPGNT